MGNIIPTPISTITDVTQLNNKLQEINDTYTRAVPLGSIFAFSGSTTISTTTKNRVPEGYLICNGEQYFQSDYPDLFKIIGTMYNTTIPNVTTDADKFRVPDLRDKFIYGTNSNSLTSTPGGNLNGGNITLASNNLPAHTHSIPALTTKADGLGHTHTSSGLSTAGAGDHSHILVDDSNNQQKIYRWWQSFSGSSGTPKTLGDTSDMRPTYNDPYITKTNTVPTHTHVITGNITGGQHRHTIDATNTGNNSVPTTGVAPINILPPLVRMIYIIKAKHINFANSTTGISQTYMEQYAENYKIPQIRYYHKRENYKNSNINFIGI